MQILWNDLVKDLKKKLDQQDGDKTENSPGDVKVNVNTKDSIEPQLQLLGSAFSSLNLDIHFRYSILTGING